MMFQGAGGGLPPQLMQMLARGPGAAAPMGAGAAPRVPMPGFSPGAGGAIPQGGGMFGGMGPQQKPSGPFGQLDPMTILSMANMFKPSPGGAPGGGPGGGAPGGGMPQNILPAAMQGGGGGGGIAELLKMLGGVY